MWLIALLIFTCCFWVLYLALTRTMGSRVTIQERLTALAEQRQPAAAVREDASRANRLLSRFSPIRSLEETLDQADLPIKPTEFLMITAACGLVFGLLGWLVSRKAGMLPAMGLFGLLAPLMWVRMRRAARRDAFNRQIPDALQAVSNSLRAGYGFSQGMTVVANDLPAPVSVEFARAMREMNLGLPVEEVLKNMAQRMQSPDFDLAVSGILINRQVGGNLAELLDHITATIRERVTLKNFIKVLTAEQRLSAIVVMAAPPVLLAVLFVAMREYTSYLLTTPMGHAMLAGSVVMQVLGVYFIRRIIAIEV